MRLMDNILTLEEVAELLRVSPSTIYRLLHNSKMPAFRVGSDWRFRQEAVERWVTQLTVKPADKRAS
jgi:excisionase family DNA binding protein